MNIGDIEVGLGHPFVFISGPCVIESEKLAMQTAEKLKRVTEDLEIPFIYKSSFDKANRSSHGSFRGPGISTGLDILNKIKEEIDVMVLTDVHEDTPLDEVASIVDVLQTPAFLCRQTNFIYNVAACGKPMNIKKGQFLSPQEMSNVVGKAKAAGNHDVMLCERGACFGYNNLVADMRSLVVMRQSGCPVVFDATHSVQLPGGRGIVSGGQREFVAPLARAAVATGVAGVFMESHPHPEEALSDGPNSWPLEQVRPLLLSLREVDFVSKKYGFPENDLIEISGSKDKHIV